jgi:hypothetical protein
VGSRADLARALFPLERGCAFLDLTQDLRNQLVGLFQDSLIVLAQRLVRIENFANLLGSRTFAFVLVNSTDIGIVPFVKPFKEVYLVTHDHALLSQHRPDR